MGVNEQTFQFITETFESATECKNLFFVSITIAWNEFGVRDR